MDYNNELTDSRGTGPRRTARGAVRDAKGVIGAALPIAVLVVAGVKLQLLFSANIHWDEFLFLSRVFDFARGDLGSAFQTFHVHLFSWLTILPGNAVDHVIAGRLVTHATMLGALVCAFMLGLRLVGPTGAWFAVLATLGHSYFLLHGGAFRADSLITFLALLAAVLIVYRPLSWRAHVAGGLSIALAMAISVKSLFFGPMLAGLWLLVFWTAADRKAVVVPFAVFSATALSAYLALHKFHATVLGSGSVTDTAGRVAGIGERMWAQPQWDYLTHTLVVDGVFWLLAAAGLSGIVYRVFRRNGHERAGALMLLVLVLPALTLTFYRNAYPYYYVTLLPTMGLLAGFAVAAIQARLSTMASTAVIAVCAVPLLWNVYGHTRELEQPFAAYTVEPQRQLVEMARTLFPDPVPYIGRAGMIASYPRQGPLMSTLVLSGYRHAGEPIMEDLVRREQPVFVLANVEGLRLSADWEEVRRSPHRLLREDFEYLQDHYVHHWGPIWVAGQRITPPTGESLRVRVPVTGTYAVESAAPVMIDGAEYGNGDTVRLGGEHVVRSRGESGEVVLRYGGRLPVAETTPPVALFRGML